MSTIIFEWLVTANRVAYPNFLLFWYGNVDKVQLGSVLTNEKKIRYTYSLAGSQRKEREIGLPQRKLTYIHLGYCIMAMDRK